MGRTIFAMLLACLAIGGTERIKRPEGTLTDDTRDKALDLATRYWDGLLQEEPLLGTEVGDDRFDDRLPDPSEEGLARRKEFMEGAVAEAAELDHSALDQDTRVTIELLEAI